LSFLLDTNVLSETRKRRRDKGVLAWIADTPNERVYLSVLTVGEIERGISRLRRRGDHHQVAIFETWLGDVLEAFGDRIVPITVEVARQWGARSWGRSLPVPDALIAATAQVHGWTVVTRNIKDFELTGARVLNPFSGEG
jgi:predicted nucleic acid-binding protein